MARPASRVVPLRAPSVASLALLACSFAAGAPRAVRAADAPGAPSAPSADARPPATRAALAFLEHLGWRIETDATAAGPRVHEGRPGSRASIEAARAAGDLVLVLPADRSPAALAAVEAAVAQAADGVGSRLAWQHRMRPAVEAATSRLSAAADRGTYAFPSMLGITSPVFVFTPPANRWTEAGAGAYVPRGAPSAALAAFYTDSALAECLVGQTVATLLTQREMLGDAAFDEVYADDGAAVGRLDGYQATSIGKTLTAPGVGAWQCLVIPQRELGSADPGVLIARHGPVAFTGFTGFLRDQTGADRANENVVVVSCTEAASEALRTEGGFGVVARLTQELLDLRKAERAPFMTAARLAPVRQRQRELEAHPVLTGIRVYIHPHGVKTLGEIVAKHRGKNRSALEWYPYVSAREDAYYQRYRRAFETRFLRGLPLR